MADPALYAETLIRDGGQKAGPRFDELYTAWLDDFAARGVTGVGFGILTLRRPVRSGAPLRRFEENFATLSDPLGEVFASGLAVHDRLAGLTDPGDLGSLDAVLLSTEPYRFTQVHADALEKQIGIPVLLVDGEMMSWYGSRALAGVRYLRELRAMLEGS